MLRGAALAITLVAVPALAYGCGGPVDRSTPSVRSAVSSESSRSSHADPQCHPTGSLPHQVDLDGPIASDGSGGTPFTDTKPGRTVVERSTPLVVDVAGDQPVVVDRVALEPYDGVPSPTLVRVQVVTASGRLGGPAQCATLRPGTTRLLFTLTTRAQLAINQTTQIIYHTLDGHEYGAVFATTYALCGPRFPDMRCAERADRLRSRAS